MFLKVYWRTYLRHNLNPADYFTKIKEKYGDAFTYSEMNTINVVVSSSDLAEYRKRHLVISTDSSIMLKEMVGVCHVESEAQAKEMAEAVDDCVFAEYVSQYRFDRCPA